MKKFIYLILLILTSQVLYGCNQEEQINVLFEDKIVEYDGKSHTITPKNMPEGVEYSYSIESQNGFVDAGSYEIEILAQLNEDYQTSFKATLTINRKKVSIVVEDSVVVNGVYPEPKYQVLGLLEGDSLEEEVWYTDNTLMYKWENKNYEVSVIRGKILQSSVLLDTFTDLDYRLDNAIRINPGLAPYTFTGLDVIKNKTITSIKFLYLGKVAFYENGNPYYANSFYLPIYIIKDDLSTLKEDCTIENGKKILIDITDIILNSNNNEIITISDLNIKIGPDETIAIGDTDMTFYMGCYDNNVNNQITRNVFTEKLKTGHSALIQIEGTW